MKFTLKIDEPCQENWAEMTKTEQGKYCKVCRKDLPDFSHLSDRNIYELITSGDNICGKFSQKQLMSNFESTHIHKIKKFGAIASFTSLLTLLNPTQSKANNSTQFVKSIVNNPIISLPLTSPDSVVIEGMVFSVDEGPMPFVKVLINDTTYRTLTDFDGAFSFKLPRTLFNNEVVLEVNYIGYDSRLILITENTPFLKIDLTSMEQIIMGIVCVVEEPTKFQKFTDVFRRKKKKKYKHV